MVQIAEKICHRCKKALPTAEFPVDRRTPSGCAANCKKCRDELRATVTEKRCSRCGEVREASMFCKGTTNADDLYVWCKDCTKDYKTERRYKLSPNQYRELAKDGCNICGSFDRLAVDHDHTCCPGTGKITCGQCVRGVLCRAHNQGLGNFQDNPEMLQAAIDYLIARPVNPIALSS